MVKGSRVAPSTKFEQVLHASAQMPGVRIDRDKFLRSELKRYCPVDQVDLAVATTPAEAGVPIDVVSKIANSVIKNETTRVTTISAVAGIPGGFAAAGTVRPTSRSTTAMSCALSRSSRTYTAGPTCLTTTATASTLLPRACSRCSLASCLE